jgi:hypothetical protein
VRLLKGLQHLVDGEARGLLARWVLLERGEELSHLLLRRHANGRFDLEPASDGGCEVTVTKSLNRLLAGLDEYLRTGTQIEKGWTPAAAA